MKICLVSDLHLEFKDIPVIKNDADVLILGGDICVADHFTKSENSPYYPYQQLYLNFFQECSKNFKHVLYVLGNHEHYHGNFNHSAGILKNAVGHLVTVLDNESVIIDGVKFIGTTLWTDCNKQNPITMDILKQGMNDYRIVKYNQGESYFRLGPVHTAKAHATALEFIKNEAAGHDNVVVIGHHAPTHKSIGEKYKAEFHMNGGYSSDLSELILDNPQIKLWTLGHVHHAHQYYIGDTLVACNPKGYPGEVSTWNPDRILDLSHLPSHEEVDANYQWTTKAP